MQRQELEGITFNLNIRIFCQSYTYGHDDEFGLLLAETMEVSRQSGDDHLETVVIQFDEQLPVESFIIEDMRKYMRNGD